jgi:hypothetical protein
VPDSTPSVAGLIRHLFSSYDPPDYGNILMITNDNRRAEQSLITMVPFPEGY